MADLADAIFARLSTDSGVSAIVGSSTAARVYPVWDRVADHVFPLVVYKIDVSQDVAFDGPISLATGNIRIAAVARSYDAAVALANAIMASLIGASGTWAGVEVQGVFPAEQNSIADDVVNDPATENVLFYIRELTFDAAFTA